MDAPVVYPFHLGVVAAAGFDVPDLARRLRPRLRTLLDRQVRRREPVSVTAVCGEPVSAAVRELAGEKGWGYGFVVRHPDRPRLVGHRGAASHVAVLADGLLAVHAEGEQIPSDLAELISWAEWVGVRVRTVGV